MQNITVYNRDDAELQFASARLPCTCNQLPLSTNIEQVSQRLAVPTQHHPKDEA